MTDTVDATKAKLSQILEGAVQPENIKLILQEADNSGEELEEGKTLADAKCTPSAVVYMVFKKPDTEDEWEEINMPKGE